MEAAIAKFLANPDNGLARIRSNKLLLGDDERSQKRDCLAVCAMADELFDVSSHVFVRRNVHTVQISTQSIEGLFNTMMTEPMIMNVCNLRRVIDNGCRWNCGPW
jgi:hypothetical protein